MEPLDEHCAHLHPELLVLGADRGGHPPGVQGEHPQPHHRLGENIEIKFNIWFLTLKKRK